MGSHSVICNPAEATFPPLRQLIKADTRFSVFQRVAKCFNSSHSCTMLDCHSCIILFYYWFRLFYQNTNVVGNGSV